MQQTINDTQRTLADAAAQHRSTQMAEQRIMDSATERLSAVEHELTSMAGRTTTDNEAGARYQELTLERGVLNHVLAKARHALAG